MPWVYSESTETRRRARRERQMANDSTNSMRSSAMSDVFIVSCTLLIGYLQSGPRLCYLRVPVAKYFASPTPNFRLIRSLLYLSRV